MGNIADDDESNFDAFLGGFGSHANIKKRQKAENMAALPPSDGRRDISAVNHFKWSHC